MNKPSRTVLIVDDCVEDLALYRRYLLHDPEYSYTILEATLGAQGLALWKQHQPDAVLLDYRLTDLDGLEFLAKLEPSTPCFPIIMITGQGNEAVAVQAMKAGAQDYLVKNHFTPEELQLAVSNTITKVQLHTQLQQSLKRELLCYQMAQKIHQTLDLNEILETTVTEVREFLQTDRVVIFRIHQNGSGTVIAESVGADWNSLLSTTYDDPCFTQHCAEGLQGGVVILKSDIYDGSLASCQVELLAKLQVRASLVTPILQNGLLWGMLIAHHCIRTRHWEVSEVDLLKQVTIQVGTALQQALLYQNIQIELVERRRLEAQLSKSEEWYRTLFESIDEGFCTIKVVFDEQNRPFDYQFLETNPAFEKQTGLNNVRGKRAFELLPDLEEHLLEVYANVALTGDSIRFTNYIKALGKWYDIYAFQIGLPEPQTVAILFNDSTYRELAAQAREQLLAQTQSAQVEAERANLVKDQFLAILSHELRTPLNPILGWAKLLQTHTFDPEQTRDALKSIERNAELQAHLIDDLLDIAKVLNGKLSIEMLPVSLASIIELALDTVRSSAQAKSILVHVSLMDNASVMGDGIRLQQLIWNLLSNSIKFTPNHGQVNIRLERIDDQAQITLTDTGKGISPDLLAHIFDLFWQEDSSNTRRYGGLGLGLTIVRQLVEAHGGTILAESPGEGLGSTFTIRLPLLPEDCPIEQAQPAPELEVDLRGIRLLVVDDDLNTCEMLEVLLTQYGGEVMGVTSATQALDRLEAFRPDILLSDIGMPEINGHALIQQIRSLPSSKGGEVKAIALTAYSTHEDQQLALNSGFHCHVNKPFKMEELLQTVVRLVTPELHSSSNSGAQG